MNLLMNRNPFAEFDDIVRSMERTLDTAWRQATVSLPMDVYEKDDALYVRAAVPGLREEDLDLSVDQNVITLKGVNRCEWEGEGTKVFLRESPYGGFARSVRIPEGYRVDDAEAGFDRGVLTIRVPKAEASGPNVRSIPIRGSITNSPPQAAIEATNANPPESAKGKKRQETKA
ncbi:MAG: Hsp20/alpha crystallin family protein [Verrucomicrobiaceae bacterium]|nr:MAG: Hsp20/alpha crystallin family protein [Verrucomicrobiaceae bacterium]